MIEGRTLTVVAILTRRSRGPARCRWVAEICDPGNPVAGVRACGISPRRAAYALARAIWDAVLDGSAGLTADEVHEVEVISARSTHFALPPHQANAST